jgi:uracil-DNA glycosylase
MAKGGQQTALKFATLAVQMKRCGKCGLPRGVSAVFGRFDSPRWMLVGQAPGKREVMLGRPFVGAAGRRLFKWLAEAGFVEQEFQSFCYVTAMMKCFPGSGERGDLKPTRQQVANCAPWLEQELALVRPAVLIPVGQLAIGRFLGKARLEELIGRRFHRLIAGRKVTVIPFPHPSGASAWTNRPENRRLTGRAINLIARTQGPSPRPETEVPNGVASA